MIDVHQLRDLLATGETICAEFKSDRKQLPDSVFYEEIVALANTDGGVFIVGVEDDGAVTGAAPRHGQITDPRRLQAAIFNNTVPSINTRVSIVQYGDFPVIAIEVDSYPEPCATASGKSLRRALKPDGKPQTIPWYPRDQRSRRIDLGLLDFSAQRLTDLSFDSLNPLEFERVRRAIVRLRGDRSLAEMSDRELAQALKLVETIDGELVPNVSGLLLVGREESIEGLLPTHALHFQVLEPNGDVRVNDSFRGPLLAVLEDVEARFNARNEEREVTVGMFRLPIPDYSAEGFREAVNNAMLHRDYSRNESVYLQWYHDHMLFTNPGGFPEGISLANLLVHEPKPRNVRLAEAFKRIGLIEQTGRGIDKIYWGQLRYGRPLPDYSRSDDRTVRVVVPGGPASLQFATFVFEQDRAGTPLSLDELIVLYGLERDRRCDSGTAGQWIQKGLDAGRQVIERLVERGLVTARGDGRGRVYHLSAQVYRKFGTPTGYVRTHGIDEVKHEALVLQAVPANNGRVERKHVMDLLGLSGPQANRLLGKMCQAGKLERRGTPPRWTFYVIPDS